MSVVSPDSYFKRHLAKETIPGWDFPADGIRLSLRLFSSEHLIL